jgi:hypothetical protein
VKLVSHTKGGTWIQGVSKQDRVRQKRVLKKIFGLKREEEAGGWRKLHKEGLRNLNASANIRRLRKSRKMRWTDPVACMGEMRNAQKVLVGKT